MIYFPFFLGIVLNILNIINLFSVLCLFCGGYIAIKNTFDYRTVKKNNNYVNNKTYYKRNDDVAFRSIKPRKRERVRVRKK